MLTFEREISSLKQEYTLAHNGCIYTYVLAHNTRIHTRIMHAYTLTHNACTYTNT